MIQESEEPPSLWLRLKFIRHKMTGGLSKLRFLIKSIRLSLIEFTENNQIEKKFLQTLGILVVLAFIPIISDYTVNQEIYSSLKKYSPPPDPVKTADLADELGKFTSGVEEKHDDIALTAMLESNSYTLSQQLTVNADKNIPGPERAEATYTVGQGESLTQIATKFNLHVATILDANGINPVEAKKIKSGTVLKIPSSDTSTSNEWMVAIKKAEDEERQVQEKARQEALRQKQLKSRALAASSSRYGTKRSSSEGYGRLDAGDLIVPISSKGISRGLGGGHTGIDYMADIGTAVSAAASGRVVQVSSGWSGGYGNQILVDHGGGRQTRYAHLSSINVSAGDEVGRGQVIGYSGNTGRSTGPHLHFEAIVNGRPVNPF